MAETEFAIAPTDFQDYLTLPCVEPVIDGIGLVDRVARIVREREPYLGLFDVDDALADWAQVERDARPRRIVVLGCGCGDARCASVLATARATSESVEWSRFADNRGSPLAGLGPFVFERSEYLAAATGPTHHDGPVRRQHDLKALAAGRPADPDAWFDEMCIALGRDLCSPFAPEVTQQTFAAGLHARAAAGNPIDDDAVRRWARRLKPPFGQEGTERVVERVRAIAGP